MRKRPIYPIHSGKILADELAELNTTPTGLVRVLHVPANRISQLVAGKRGMTADTALRLEKWRRKPLSGMNLNSVRHNSCCGASKPG